MPADTSAASTYRPRMHANRRFQFAAAFVAWASVLLTVLLVLGAFSFELFFVLALLSYLAAVELATPGTISLPWSKRLQWFSMLGLMVMVGIFVREALETLPENLLP